MSIDPRPPGAWQVIALCISMGVLALVIALTSDVEQVRTAAWFSIGMQVGMAWGVFSWSNMGARR